MAKEDKMSEKRGQRGRFKSRGREVQVNGTQVKLIKAELNITAVGNLKKTKTRRMKGKKIYKIRQEIANKNPEP